MFRSLSRRAILAATSAALVAAVPFAAARAADKKLIAFVVNVPADFWVIARRGLEKAAAEHPNYDVQMFVPGEGVVAAVERVGDVAGQVGQARGSHPDRSG